MNLATAVVTFDPGAHVFIFNGAPVSPQGMQGVANSAVNHASFRMSDIAGKLQRGEITLAAWYEQMQAEVLNMHAAEFALAHGGFANMTAPDWERCAEMVTDKLERLAVFGADIENGRYGALAESKAFNQRVGLYANDGRSTYENEHGRAFADATGATLMWRVRGALDSCPSCIAWDEDNLGHIPVDEMLSEHAIGMSECGANCHCLLLSGIL